MLETAKHPHIIAAPPRAPTFAGRSPRESCSRSTRTLLHQPLGHAPRSMPQVCSGCPLEFPPERRDSARASMSEGGAPSPCWPVPIGRRNARCELMGGHTILHHGRGVESAGPRAHIPNRKVLLGFRTVTVWCACLVTPGVGTEEATFLHLNGQTSSTTGASILNHLPRSSRSSRKDRAMAPAHMSAS